MGDILENCDEMLVLAIIGDTKQTDHAEVINKKKIAEKGEEEDVSIRCPSPIMYSIIAPLDQKFKMFACLCMVCRSIIFVS